MRVMCSVAPISYGTPMKLPIKRNVFLAVLLQHVAVFVCIVLRRICCRVIWITALFRLAGRLRLLLCSGQHVLTAAVAVGGSRQFGDRSVEHHRG